MAKMSQKNRPFDSFVEFHGKYDFLYLRFGVPDSAQQKMRGLTTQGTVLRAENTGERLKIGKESMQVIETDHGYIPGNL